MTETIGAQVDFDPSAYTIIVRRVTMNGAAVFHGKVVELPDLEAFEPTYENAYNFLVDAIQTAKAAFDEQGRHFPAPSPGETSEYSGRVTIRMPKWLHARLDLAAQADGTSLNQYMVAVLASAPGAAGQPAPMLAQPSAAPIDIVGAASIATRAVARVTMASATPTTQMEPLVGSIVRGIQNITYHPSRPVFRTELEKWGDEPVRVVAKRTGVIRKRK